LFTGIAVFGAVGSGKTSACLYPYAEQVLAYEAANPQRRIGGLVLEVKGDFCQKVRGILTRHGRDEDYVEIGLDSKYRYNPLHNGLDAYALAYSIASPRASFRCTSHASELLQNTACDVLAYRRATSFDAL
jgi:hypothetical protein